MIKQGLSVPHGLRCSLSSTLPSYFPVVQNGVRGQWKQCQQTFLGHAHKVEYFWEASTFCHLQLSSSPEWFTFTGNFKSDSSLVFWMLLFFCAHRKHTQWILGKCTAGSLCEFVFYWIDKQWLRMHLKTSLKKGGRIHMNIKWHQRDVKETTPRPPRILTDDAQHRRNDLIWSDLVVSQEWRYMLVLACIWLFTITIYFLHS